MGLIGSMYIGRTGLVNMSKGISVTSDNLSNLNTFGFKGNRPAFSDIFSRYNVGNKKGIGLGTQLQTVDTIFTNGSINVTDVPTDLAIHGKGFFMVYDDKTGKVFYTRNGMFHLEQLDENYLKLVNPSGMALTGQQLNGIGTNISGTGEIVIPRNLAGKATNYVNLRFNLDSTIEPETEDAPLAEAWDGTKDPPIDPSKYDWLMKVPIVDAQGQTRELTFYFDRTTQENEYEFIIVDDPQAEQPLVSGKFIFNAKGLVSNIEGVDLVSGAEAKALVPDLVVDDNAALMQLNLGEGDQENPLFIDLGLFYDEENNLVGDQNSISSYASPFVNYYQNQNGYPPGFLQDVFINDEGVVHATYSNGQTLEVAQVLLGAFPSDTVLYRVGQTLFEAPPDIQPAIFEPGKNAPASIISGALEASNVDIAQEMINLITFQRVFQSNSKIVTVSDQLLEDVIRMK